MSSGMNVGRVAKLCNLVSKPELNGCFVTIVGYNDASERFAIRTLQLPNKPGDVVSIAVKLSSLEFLFTNTFESQFPNAPTRRGMFSINNYEPGTILDYRTCTNVSGLHAFTVSCRVLGAPSRDTTGPTTVFPNDAVITPNADPDSIIEIENISFKTVVRCKVGNNITFRACKFSAPHGVSVTSSRILFENCVFDSNTQYSVALGEDSHITLLNCTFQNTLPDVTDGVQGIVPEEGCTVTAIHCTFIRMDVAINAQAKTKSLDLLNCSFVDGGTVSVCLNDGTTGTVRGCRWQGGNQEALKLEGPKRCTLLVQDSVVTQCHSGLYAGHGKMDITLQNTEISHNKCHGMILGMGIAGKVNISGCRITGNGMRDIANMCGPHCPVTIDGVVQEQGGQLERIQQITPELKNLNTREHSPDTRVPLKVLRAHKKTLTAAVLCENCEKVEPLEEKFSVCSKCKNVCYCSRECQVSHWKEVHKKECGKIVYA